LPEVGSAQKVATQVSRRKWYDMRSRQFRAIFALCAAKSRSDHADHQNSDAGDRGKPIANIVLHRNKK
jgi:hypothetical protein